MLLLGTAGSALTATPGAVSLFVGTTVVTLCRVTQLECIGASFIAATTVLGGWNICLYTLESSWDLRGRSGCYALMTLAIGPNDKRCVMTTFDTHRSGTETFGGNCFIRSSLRSHPCSELKRASRAIAFTRGWSAHGCCSNFRGRLRSMG